LTKHTQCTIFRVEKNITRIDKNIFNDEYEMRSIRVLKKTDNR